PGIRIPVAEEGWGEVSLLITKLMPLRAPRHFKTSTSRPCSLACKRRRMAAGEGSSAADGDLYKKPMLPPDSAASCNRRTSRSFAVEHQASTAPNDLQRNVCSNAHSASSLARASMTA